MTNKRIIFAGTPEFAVPALQALLHSAHTVVAVYTQPDRQAGRGLKLQASPVKLSALAQQIPVYQPTTLKTPEVQAKLRALDADLMVVVAYGLILPQAVLETPRYGCVNVHASLLPRWRGAAPIQRAILAGDTVTGITLMQMDVGLDTGAMLKTVTVEILPEDTGPTLHDKLAQFGGQLLAEHIDNIENLPKISQDDTQATYAKKLEKAEAQLDWQEPASGLLRKIRAFNPWPVAQAQLFGQTLRIWEAQALPITDAQSSVAAGSVIRSQRDGIEVMTGAGVLRLLKIQKAGGKVISVGDFLNAHPQLRS